MNVRPASFPSILLCALMAIALCGCGVKPGKVAAPAGSDGGTTPFPRVYPAPQSPLDTPPATMDKPAQAATITPRAESDAMRKPTAAGAQKRHVFRP